jgi:hypothetical protein
VRVQSLGIAVLYAALAACVSPTANEPQVVELRTDRSSYVVGDTARLTLTNQGPHAVYATLSVCNLNVERSVGDSWESAGGFNVACVQVFGRRLEPGASTEQEIKIVIPPFALFGGERPRSRRVIGQPTA